MLQSPHLSSSSSLFSLLQPFYLHFLYHYLLTFHRNYDEPFYHWLAVVDLDSLMVIYRRLSNVSTIYFVWYLHLGSVRKIFESWKRWKKRLVQNMKIWILEIVSGFWKCVRQGKKYSFFKCLLYLLPVMPSQLNSSKTIFATYPHTKFGKCFSWQLNLHVSHFLHKTCLRIPAKYVIDSWDLSGQLKCLHIF